MTKLQLDNNVIEKIEGLESLKNLVWLGKKIQIYYKSKILLYLVYFKDLSFNNIEKIEGLDALTKLTDLSLFNNQITKLDNMDALERLEVFSIGNNLLNDYSFVKEFIYNGLMVYRI